MVSATPILPNPISSPKRKGRKKWLVVVVILFGLLGWVVLASLKKNDLAISVQSEKVVRHSITETVVANGIIYPVKQVHISPEVSGEITELKVKEGQFVHRGDLLLKIKPEFYLAVLNQAQANYQSSLAGKTTAAANLEKAEAEFKRNKELFAQKLLPESDYISFKVADAVARAQLEGSRHQVDVAKANVDSAQDSLDKTTIMAPMDGTITKLNSQAGERVLGTVQNAGTDIMVISDLSAIEARVDIGESDIVNLQPGQKAKMEVDSFKDKKFAGVVTDVANSSEGLDARSVTGSGGSSSQQSATLFQVRILFQEVARFRPGMSVTATVETRTRTNVIAVPIGAVTTRNLEAKQKIDGVTNGVSVVATNLASSDRADKSSDDKNAANRNKQVDVVFVVDGDKVKAVPVKLGISDDNFYEITEGLKEGDEIIIGKQNAINHTLDDGKKITKTAANKDSKDEKIN